MAKIDMVQLANYLSNIWVLQIRESEAGYGSSTWIELFDDYKEAICRMHNVNSDSPLDCVPDYYIVADNPKLFCDYYNINFKK